MVTWICSSHTGVTASSHKTFPKTNADSLVQPWVIPTNRPIDARLLRVSSNTDSELPKRNFHKMYTWPSWVDPVPFRGTGRQWIISNHWNATRSPLPLCWDRWCSLRLVSGAAPSEEAWDSEAAQRVVCDPTGTTMQICRESGGGLSIQHSKAPRYPSLLRNTVHGTSGPGARPSNHRSCFTRRAWVLKRAMINCAIRVR